MCAVKETNAINAFIDLQQVQAFLLGVDTIVGSFRACADHLFLAAEFLVPRPENVIFCFTASLVRESLGCRVVVLLLLGEIASVLFDVTHGVQGACAVGGSCSAARVLSLAAFSGSCLAASRALLSVGNFSGLMPRAAPPGAVWVFVL